jgi:hypothetical protein
MPACGPKLYPAGTLKLQELRLPQFSLVVANLTSPAHLERDNRLHLPHWPTGLRRVKLAKVRKTQLVAILTQLLLVLFRCKKPWFFNLLLL